jgi:hypothetical protein
MNLMHGSVSLMHGSVSLECAEIHLSFTIRFLLQYNFIAVFANQHNTFITLYNIYI